MLALQCCDGSLVLIMVVVMVVQNRGTSITNCKSVVFWWFPSSVFAWSWYWVGGADSLVTDVKRPSTGQMCRMTKGIKGVYFMRACDYPFQRGKKLPLLFKWPGVASLVHPILDTRISFSSFSFSSVMLRGPPLDSEMGWTGELWSKTKFLILEN